jgi:hypothetical protein
MNREKIHYYIFHLVDRFLWCLIVFSSPLSKSGLVSLSILAFQLIILVVKISYLASCPTRKPPQLLAYAHIAQPIGTAGTYTAARVVDPHCFNADPDPAFFRIADPDPYSDPDPVPDSGF